MKTWHWTLFIHEPDTPASHALPHADGYLKATDRHTATHLARKPAAASMPGPDWYSHIQVAEATPTAAADWHRRQTAVTQPAGAPATTAARRPAEDHGATVAKDHPPRASTGPRPPAGHPAQEGTRW
jgi:hypothetical protein